MPANGQIVRIYEAAHPKTGEWTLVVEAYSDRGNIVGALTVPTNGDEGICRFTPIPELAGAALEALPPVQHGEPGPIASGAQSVQDAADADSAKIGTITSDQAPKRGGRGKSKT
jgi:hypothetical protein